MSGRKNILAIVPAYNEERNVGRVVEDILSFKPPSLNVCEFFVLVVNDGSSDGTVSEAKCAGAMVISLPFNLGIGGAVQAGFKFAKEKGFDLAVQIDGDRQHDIKHVMKLINPVINGEVDMVIGSRFIPPNLGYRSSFVRRAGINFFACLISFLTDYKITDPTSGFRCFNKKMINIFANYYPGDFPEPEAIVVAGRHKARIKEAPVKMRKRASGNSSIRYLKTLYYMIKVTFAILLDRLKKEPLRNKL